MQKYFYPGKVSWAGISLLRKVVWADKSLARKIIPSLESSVKEFVPRKYCGELPWKGILRRESLTANSRRSNLCMGKVLWAIKPLGKVS